MDKRSLAGYSPWVRKESDTTERLHFHWHHSCEYKCVLQALPQREEAIGEELTPVQLLSQEVGRLSRALGPTLSNGVQGGGCVAWAGGQWPTPSTGPASSEPPFCVHRTPPLGRS